jgi:imidazolonepropionase-like amidohydrolase
MRWVLTGHVQQIISFLEEMTMTRNHQRLPIMVLGFTLAMLAVIPLHTAAQELAAITAFTGARIIDGTGAEPFENGVLVVRDGRVLAAGNAAEVAIPADAELIDLGGKTIMPGMVNAHGHVADDTAEKLAVYARYGVTTVVSLGGEDASHVAFRDAQDAASPSEARLHIAGPVQEHQTAEAAVAAVAQLKALDVDFVKARVQMGSMPEAAYSALIAEAHRQGLKVAAHMYTLADAKGLVQSGVDVLAHSVRDAPVDAELLALMSQNDTCYIPTLARDVSTYIYESIPDFFGDPFFLREADLDEINNLSRPEAMRAMAQRAQQGKDDVAMGQRNVKALHDGGVRIALGTDSGLPGRFAGYFEHMELKLLADAGLAPMAIIQAATAVAADCMDLEEVGTLTEGKWADFIVMNANPLDDITNTRTLEAVWMAGKRVPGREE